MMIYYPGRNTTVTNSVDAKLLEKMSVPCGIKIFVKYLRDSPAKI
jgi:hypothetical protein